MIKVSKHRLVCRCRDCADMFPQGGYDAVWGRRPHDDEGLRRAIGRVPIGNPAASLAFNLVVTPEGRLAEDWPGFPGTAGARVELDDADPPHVIGTHDPALSALAEPIPLRRLAAERLNGRCMVEYGLASPEAADFVTCPVHGELAGIAALSCHHLGEAAPATPIVVVYSVDADYPDAFCERCYARYAAGQVEVALTVCSRCQQRRLYRHPIAQSTWYGSSA